MNLPERVVKKLSTFYVIQYCIAVFQQRLHPENDHQPDKANPQRDTVFLEDTF